MRLRIRVSKYEQFGRLAHRFRDAANGDLQRDATAELVASAPPVLAAVRGAVLGASFPVRPEGDGQSPSKGLRGRLAAATHVDPLTRGNGIRFTVEYEEVDPKWGRRLAMLTDVELAPRWRHPVFGDRDLWVTQYGQPWFHAPIRAGRPTYQAGVHRAMERTARKITTGR